MLIKETLVRDPLLEGLVNNGQARISGDNDANVMRELRGELSHFVCEKQYADGIVRILSSFLAGLSQTNQKAAWVSGFYGSGKSHLLKMLCHLWRNTEFDDGATARSLVPDMPEDVDHLLRELDVAGRRTGGLLAAAGTLLGGNEEVRSNILSIFLKACNLPTQYAGASFQLWLEERGFFDQVKAKIEAAGKTWEQELKHLYVSPVIARALLACDSSFASSEVAAKDLIKTQFPLLRRDLSTEEFVAMFKRVLKRQGIGGQLPCTILVLDEVQQYISNSEAVSSFFTEATEAISKQLDSQVIVVASGQSALHGTKLLEKMLDRFTVRVALSDADVETVTRKVLLRKQASAVAPIFELVEKHAGEVSRQLQGTKIGEKPEDKATVVEDYPLLPVRRRFWEQCFRQVDSYGTRSQLRSQLRIIHDSLAKIAQQPIGRVIPTDDLYEALAPELVAMAVLPREISERIAALGQNGKPDSILKQRICATIFLISQLPRSSGADLGIRATKDHIADLLVEDFTADNGRLRAEVERLVQELSDASVLMRVGDEYLMQTQEGRDWDQEFRKRAAKYRNDAALFDEKRDQYFAAEMQKALSAVKLVQGVAKESRRWNVQRSQDVPASDGESVVIWIRDQFSQSEKDFLNAAKAAGSSSPVLFAYIPRREVNELQGAIAEEAAAQQVLDRKGAPSSPEGQTARQSMESRHRLAKERRESLVASIVGSAKVFQGGGSELLQATLPEKLEAGAKDALMRLFPEFHHADHPASSWAAAIKRAREGAEQPFAPVKHDGPVEQHPVAKQVLAAIGSGNTGTQIRRELQRAPYGWPQDAIDAALIALHRTQHISATHNGIAVPAGQLEQAKIAKTEFRVEKITLGVKDRQTVRAVFLELGITVGSKMEDLALKAPDFISSFFSLPGEAGGEPPLPPPPDSSAFHDLRHLYGNECLAAIRDKESELKRFIADCKTRRDLLQKRRPSWDVLVRLADKATGIPAAAPLLAERDAIRMNRMLLDAEDRVAPVRTALCDLLRTALNDSHTETDSAYANAVAELNANEIWKNISAGDEDRILKDSGLSAPPPPLTASDQTILKELDAKSLAARKAETDAIPGRVAKALQQAAKLLEPKTQFVTLEKALLRSEPEIDEWLARQRNLLVKQLADGPVQVQ